MVKFAFSNNIMNNWNLNINLYEKIYFTIKFLKSGFKANTKYRE